MQPTPEFADQIFKLIERFVSSPHIAKVKPSVTSEQHKRTYGGEFGRHLYKHKLSIYESEMREVWERVLNHNHKDEVQAARMCKIFLDAKIVDPSEIFIFSGRSTGKPYYHPALDYASCPAVARLLLDAGANPDISGDDRDFIHRITSNHNKEFLTPEWAALISHPTFVAKVSEHDATFSENNYYSHPVAQVSRGNNLIQMTELLKSYEVNSDIIKFCIANSEGTREMKDLLKEHAVTRNIQYEGHETQFQRKWRLEREERQKAAEKSQNN